MDTKHFPISEQKRDEIQKRQEENQMKIFEGKEKFRYEV